jgi:hypothetical protein
VPVRLSADDWAALPQRRWRPASNAQQVVDLKEALAGGQQDSDEADPKGALRRSVNAALRALCGSVEVDHEHGELVLNFLHGGSVALTFAYRFEMQCWLTISQLTGYN